MSSSEKKQQTETMLEEMYIESETSTASPRKNNRIVVYGMLSVIAGLIAGFVGVMLVLSGTLSGVPLFSAFRLDRILPEQHVVVTQRQEVTVEQQEHLYELVPLVRSGVVVFVSETTTGTIYTNDDIAGFGMVVADDGWILTTNEVLSHGRISTMGVITTSGDLYTVDDVVEDPATEYVFVRIAARDLHSLAFASDDPLSSGTPLISTEISLPSGQLVIDEYRVRQLQEINSDQSDTTLLRSIVLNTKPLYSGPIVDLSGNVVGFSLTDGTVIPSYYISSHVSHALLTQGIIRFDIGITWLDLHGAIGLDEALRQGLYKGALVTAVEKGSIAEKAGIRKNDIIRRVNDIEVNGGLSFSEMIQQYNVGDTVFLTVLRDGEELEFEYTLTSE